MTLAVVTDLTTQGVRRVALVVGISYDIEQARKVAMSQVRADARTRRARRQCGRLRARRTP